MWVDGRAGRAGRWGQRLAVAATPLEESSFHLFI